MKIRASLKKVISVVLWCTIGSTALALLVAAINKKNSSLCNGMEIRINAGGKEKFVSKKEVIRLLENEGVKDLREKRVQYFNLRKLEQGLRRNLWIKDAQLYFDNNQVLKVQITERQPLLRLFTVSGKSCYIDSSGMQLPLAGPLPLKLPVFTGYPAERIGLRSDSLLDFQIKTLGLFLSQDPFWSNAVEQVNITPAKTFEIIPLIGDQVIEFGDASNYEEKFRHLLLFYKKVMTKTGFEKYTRISVEYEGQVIGTRRGGPVSVTDSLEALRNVLEMIRMARKMEADTGAVREAKPLEKNLITEQNLKSYDFPEETENVPEQKSKR